MDRARTIAREIAAETSPISVALTRQMLWRFSATSDYAEALATHGVLNTELGRGQDVKEGVMAFLEKRKPNFPGLVSRDMPPTYPWWKS